VTRSLDHGRVTVTWASESTELQIDPLQVDHIMTMATSVRIIDDRVHLAATIAVCPHVGSESRPC
jgi:hypothetical protein